MPVSLNNTQIVFNDATTQTTSGVTAVNVSTGISSTGGKTPTLTNTGVTSLTGAGTVSLSGSTGAITITGTGGSGTVTSVATGNGLSGGTITTTGTLAVACPTFNTVGSYCFCAMLRGNIYLGGVSLAAGTAANQLQICGVDNRADDARIVFTGGQISGTWRTMGWFNADDPGQYSGSLACRIS